MGHVRKDKLPLVADRVYEIRGLLEGRRTAVFLDYDGTLTPIVSRPEEAFLSQEMRAAVRRLSRLCPVAIISGRDRERLKEFVGLDGVYYAGSHGLDIEGPEGSGLRNDVGSEFGGVIQRFSARMEGDVLGVPGALVERTAYTAAVHYRLAPPERVRDVEAAVDRALLEFPTLRKTHGKMVFEVRPQLDWDKGTAVTWLLEALGLGGEGTVPIYIGDDVTDEDAFQTIREQGVGVLVSERVRETSARYMLRDTAEARWFLGWLADELEAGAAAER